MSYALITEAWKINDTKLKEQDFKQRPEVKSVIEPFDNVAKFPSTKKTTENENQPNSLGYQYYDDFRPDYDEEYDSDDEMDCASVLEHVKKCKICQSKIVQERQFSLPDNVLDILLYTITGIFILFLLDIVLRIGKNLT